MFVDASLGDATAKIKYEPTEVLLEGQRLVKFLNPQFVGLLEQKIPGIKYGHMLLFKEVKGEKKEDEEGATETIRFSLLHDSEESEQEGRLLVHVDDPKLLKVLIEAMEEFNG